MGQDLDRQRHPYVAAQPGYLPVSSFGGRFPYKRRTEAGNGGLRRLDATIDTRSLMDLLEGIRRVSLSERPSDFLF